MIEQIGGTHYQRLEYQTWDFIFDLKIDYFVGNAIKYISRYKYKNGIEDLKKAHSYLYKIISCEIKTKKYSLKNKCVIKYINQFDDATAEILKLILSKRYSCACLLIWDMVNNGCTR